MQEGCFLDAHPASGRMSVSKLQSKLWTNQARFHTLFHKSLLRITKENRRAEV